MAAIDEYILLRDRAQRFLDSSRMVLGKGYIDIAAFSAQQALELFLKSLLSKKIGDYPHTHSLSVLLEQFNSESGKCSEKANDILENNGIVLSLLQDAYISSRYFDISFREKEAREMVKFVEDTIAELANVC